MTDAVTGWVEKYLRAWMSNEPDDIGALFTEDAVYSTRPHDPDPWRGRDQIVQRWLAARDEPGDWSFEGTSLGSDGGRGFVQGVTVYGGGARTYDNLWVVDLADDGRASAFTEWFMARKQD
jgi:ketosteroid isomerase-like protein